MGAYSRLVESCRLVAVLLGVILASEAIAQPRTLAPGAKVIFENKKGERIVGTLSEITHDPVTAITLAGRPLKFPLRDLTMIRFTGQKKVILPRWSSMKHPYGLYEFHKGSGVEVHGIHGHATFNILDDKGKLHQGLSTSHLGSIGVAKTLTDVTPGPVPGKPATPGTRVDRPTVGRDRTSDGDRTRVPPRRADGARTAGGALAIPDPGQAIPTAAEIPYNGTVKGHMGPRDYDMFKFFFPGGEFICYSKGKLDLVADLMSESGKKLDRDNDCGEGKNFRFERYLERGVYGIQVRVMNYGGTGPYEIVFGDGTGARYEEKK